MARLSKDRSLPIEMSDQKVEDKRKDDECRVYGRDGLKERLTIVQVFSVQISMAGHAARAVSRKVPPISEPRSTSIAERMTTKPNSILRDCRWIQILSDRGWTQIEKLWESWPHILSPFDPRQHWGKSETMAMHLDLKNTPKAGARRWHWVRTYPPNKQRQS